MKKPIGISFEKLIPYKKSNDKLSEYKIKAEREAGDNRIEINIYDHGNSLGYFYFYSSDWGNIVETVNELINRIKYYDNCEDVEKMKSNF